MPATALSASLRKVVIRSRVADGPLTDFRVSLDRDSDASETVAAVLVGPYGRPVLYHKRQFDWLCRTITLC